MTRIQLHGAGGVGGIYTYILDKGGAEVTAVCRSNYDAVVKTGFTINSKIFGEVAVIPKVVRNAKDAQGPFDYIVICSKAAVGVSPSTADLIRPAVGPITSIVLCQNGIGIEEPYAAAFPDNTVISGVVYLPTTQEEPGKIVMGNLEWLEIGTYPASAPSRSKEAVHRLSEIFRKGGATCKPYDDIQARRWQKLMVNGSWNPTCALSLLDDANFLRSSDQAETMVRNVMLEIMKVAHARGYIDITEKDIDFQMERPIRRLETGGKEPSMLTNVRFGRTMEIEAILGNLLKIAKELKVDVPRCEVIYALAAGLNYALGRGQRVGEIQSA